MCRSGGWSSARSPTGSSSTPEDYGSLYVHSRARLHRIDPRLALGGPGYQTSIPDWVSWPTAPRRRPLLDAPVPRALRPAHARRELVVLLVRVVPVRQRLRARPAPQLARRRSCCASVLPSSAPTGCRASLPMLITEYGYSAFATRDEVELPGALLDADTVGRVPRRRRISRLPLRLRAGHPDQRAAVPQLGEPDPVPRHTTATASSSRSRPTGARGC